MDFILDTHAFIWFINGSELPISVVSKIKNVDNRCFISIASLWEIAIKTSLGKLKVESNFDAIKEFLVSNNIEILPITFEHIQLLIALPYHHGDPFDRMIITQGLVENLPVITKDPKFNLYDITVIWN